MLAQSFYGIILCGVGVVVFYFVCLLGCCGDFVVGCFWCIVCCFLVVCVVMVGFVFVSGCLVFVLVFYLCFVRRLVVVSLVGFHFCALRHVGSCWLWV